MSRQVLRGSALWVVVVLAFTCLAIGVWSARAAISWSSGSESSTVTVVAVKADDCNPGGRVGSWRSDTSCWRSEAVLPGGTEPEVICCGPTVWASVDPTGQSLIGLEVEVRCRPDGRCTEASVVSTGARVAGITLTVGIGLSFCAWLLARRRRRTPEGAVPDPPHASV